MRNKVPQRTGKKEIDLPMEFQKEIKVQQMKKLFLP